MSDAPPLTLLTADDSYLFIDFPQRSVMEARSR
jgi:hypothetical protein